MIISTTITGLYVLLLMLLLVGFIRTKSSNSVYEIPKTTFSICIPFRNESEHLPMLLHSISTLNYPKELVEFILIDDASTDNSVALIHEFKDTFKGSLQYIKNTRYSNSPKKDALTKAIELAKNKWIVTSDADCILPKNWLKAIDKKIQEASLNMICSPVSYNVTNTFLEQFQLIDCLSLQGTTIGSFGMGIPFLCNGANLAYKKKAFYQFGKFSDSNHLASGDDIFLLQKFLKADKTKVSYLKSTDALIKTHAEKSWNSVINQRVRWASKSKNYKTIFPIGIGLLVFGMNLTLVLSFFFLLFKVTITLQIVLIIAVKFSLDSFLIYTTAFFFKENIKAHIVFISCMAYPFVSVFIALKSITAQYTWKDRILK